VGNVSPISLSGSCQNKHKVVDKKEAGAFTPAGDMSPSGLSIKKLSIVVYNYATLFRLCQEQKKNRNNP